MKATNNIAEDRRAGVLLGYQQRWVADRSPVKVAEKSRRVGLTWAEAADSTLEAAEAEGQDTWYIGYNREMALEFVLDCAEWARHYHLAAGEMEEFVFQDGDRDIKAFQVVFASGNRVTALSSRPNNLRGKQGKVIIDEAAFHDDLPGLLKAAMALLMWGGRVSIISTHDGDDNPFNELIKEIRLGKLPYSVHRITLDDALKDGLYKAICQKTGKVWSEEAQEQWREELIAFYGDDADEELHAIPSRGTGVYFSRALLEANMSDEYPVLTWVCKEGFEQEPDHVREQECEDWLAVNVLPELEKIQPYEKCWLGEDFGRSGDLSIQWPLVENKNLTYRVPFLIELSNVPFKQQEQILFYVCDWFRDKARLMGIALDSRGNGEYLGEVTMQRYGENRVEQVKLTTQIYGEWMPKYKDVYVEKSWTIPKDADVVDDHRQVKMEKGIAKVPDTGRTKSKKGLQRHGDSAIAGMLAEMARATLEGGECEYEAVQEREMNIQGGLLMTLFDQFNREIAPETKPEDGMLSVASLYDNEPGFQSAGLTPQKLGAILKEATLGDPYRAMELFEELEEKDTHLMSVLQKRRGRISGLDYKVEPASQDKKDLEIAEFVLEVIEGLPDFEDNIKDITDAIGKGYAGLELCWDLKGSRNVIKNMIRVEPRRFIWRKLTDPPRLLSDGDSIEGIELKPWKFLFHVHKTKSGHPARQGILRVCSWMYLFKNFGVRDWVKFAESYGMPLRLGKYASGAKEDEKKALFNAVRAIGSNAAGIISEGTSIEFIEAAQKSGNDPFKGLADFANAEMSKAVLGQTLTTEQGDKGARSLGEVHENTEDDLLIDDCEQASKTIRRDFIRPLVGFNFGWDAPLPWLHFEYESEEDLLAEAKRYEVHLQSGVQIGADHYYEKFKIPKPENGEEVLGGRVSSKPKGEEAIPEENEDKEKSASKQELYSARDETENEDNLKGFLDRLLKEAGQDSLIAPVQNLLDESKTLEQFRDGLVDFETKLSADDIGAVLEMALKSSELLGRFESLPEEKQGQGNDS